MTKIVLAGEYGTLAEELRAEHPGVTFTVATSDAEQAAQVVDADAIYGWPTREAFLAAERLRWIQRTGTGINQIMDLPELVESDVVLTNSRGPHALPMANHVFAMMLSLAHSLPALMDAQRDHDWHAAKHIPPFVDLDGRVVGILALGDIGKAVARRAVGFGMEVYAVDKHPQTPPPGVSGLWGLDRLDDLLEISDWFVITAPLTAETRGLIDSRRLGLLKRGAYVIVISRGKIVDEEALVERLQSGHLGGARARRDGRRASAGGQPAVGHGQRRTVVAPRGPLSRRHGRRPGELQGEPPPLPGERAVHLRVRQAGRLLSTVL